MKKLWLFFYPEQSDWRADLIGGLVIALVLSVVGRICFVLVELLTPAS